LRTAKTELRGVLLRWTNNWKVSALSDEQRERALCLVLEFQDALDCGRFDDAAKSFQALHPLSQNHVRFHARGHWMNAILHRKERRLKSSAVQAYLAIMAPYGTVRRRLDGAVPADPDGRPVSR